MSYGHFSHRTAWANVTPPTDQHEPMSRLPPISMSQCHASRRSAWANVMPPTDQYQPVPHLQPISISQCHDSRRSAWANVTHPTISMSQCHASHVRQWELSGWIIALRLPVDELDASNCDLWLVWNMTEPGQGLLGARDARYIRYVWYMII